MTVFEQRSVQNTADGAGLTLFANAFEALDLMGLGVAVRKVSSGAIASMRSCQRRPSGSWLLTIPPRAIASMQSVHRAELHRVLAERLQAGTVHTGASARVSADGSPQIVANGRTEHFDLVVAADGIRSRSRQALGMDTGLRYAGCTAWRGVTVAPVDIGGEAGETWGRGQFFGIVPLPDGRIYWFATLNAAPGTVFTDDHAALRQKFADWHAPIGGGLAATPPDAVMRHDIHDLAKPLASYVRGRVALLGGAPHAMTPNLGQGAGQAIEDAATLVLILRTASTGDLDTVLARYDALRRKLFSRCIGKR